MCIKKYFLLRCMCVLFIGFINNIGICVCVHYMGIQSSKRF
jgi:hypothetical protein